MDIIGEARFQELAKNFSNIGPIIVVGDLGIDKYTYGSVNRISPEAPVPIVQVSKEWYKLGLAANISHNLKTLGVESTLCGIIGEDKNANHFEHLLEENYLKTWGILRTPNRPTTVKERITTNIQQICRVDYEVEGEIDGPTSDKILKRTLELSQDHPGIIIEDYGKGTLTEGLISGLIKKFRSEDKIVAIDPSRRTPPHFYKGASLLKPNHIEATLMAKALGYQEKNLETIAQLLVDKLDVEMLVITLGKEGMALIDTKNTDGKLKVIPTVATNVFDVSGAGDTAISLLMAGLLSGGNLEEAAWLGNCGAGVVVGKKGTATVSLDELVQFHHRLYNSFQ